MGVDWNSFLEGFTTAMSFQNLLFIIIGGLLGTIVGMLPGLGPATAVAVLIPITFGMDSTSARILLGAIYYGAMYGDRKSVVKGKEETNNQKYDKRDRNVTGVQTCALPIWIHNSHELSESVIHHHRRSARYNCRYASRAGTGYSRRGSYPDNLWYGLDERTYSARGHLLRSDVWWVQKFNPDQYSR